MPRVANSIDDPICNSTDNIVYVTLAGRKKDGVDNVQIDDGNGNLLPFKIRPDEFLIFEKGDEAAIPKFFAQFPECDVKDSKYFQESHWRAYSEGCCRSENVFHFRRASSHVRGKSKAFFAKPTKICVGGCPNGVPCVNVKHGGCKCEDKLAKAQA